jgi:hypothetical protein
VHRDIKPDNVLIRKTGEAVIADFGIAKVLGAATGLTRTGTTVGTGYYMSPEQWVGGELTAAADQYSLGVVLFETLSGSRPFHGESLTALMTSHLSDEPPDLVELRSDVPLPVCRVIARMLAKEPGDRFPRLVDALGAAGLAGPAEGTTGAVPSSAAAPAAAEGDLVDVDEVGTEPVETDLPEPDARVSDPLDPDPIAPDPAAVEFVGPGAGAPSATEVVSSPPPDARAAPSAPAPPPAETEPPVPDASEATGHGPLPESAAPEGPGGARGEADVPAREERSWVEVWGERRGLLAGFGAALVILVIWGVWSIGSGEALAGLRISSDSLELNGPGEERIVRLDGVDGSGDVIAVDGVEWTSEDPAVASVAPSGASDARIAGVGRGSTWIRAVAGGLQARIWVEVAGEERIASGGAPTDSAGIGPGPESGDGGAGETSGDPEAGGAAASDPELDPEPDTPPSIALALQGPLDLEVGERVTVRAAASPGGRIDWVVDDASLARVSGAGSEAVVEGLGPGSTVLRARVGGAEDSAPVRVDAESVAAVAVEPGTLELEPGGRSTLQATVRGVRSPRLDRSVEWVSREPEVAAVGPEGEVVSGANGRTWIVASAGAAADSAQIVVLAGTTVTGSSVGLNTTDGQVRVAAAFRVEPRTTTVCVEGEVRLDGGEWVGLGRQTIRAGPGAAQGIFQRTFEELGLPTVGNARRQVDPRARIWTGACDGPAGGEPVQVMESPPVCLVRYLARDWEIEDCG